MRSTKPGSPSSGGAEGAVIGSDGAFDAGFFADLSLSGYLHRLSRFVPSAEDPTSVWWPAISITDMRRTSQLKTVFTQSAIREAIHTILEDEGPVTTISPIDSGKNHSYRVCLQEGTNLFLKVGTRFPDAFPREPKTMKVLRRKTELPIPRVHATGKAPLGYPYAVYEFVNDSGGKWIGDLSPATAEQLCREAGSNLRSLHQITFTRCGKVGVEGSELTIVDPVPFEDILQQSLERQLTELQDTRFAKHCQPARELGNSLVDRIDFGCIRPTLVHGDYRLENLCIDPTGEQVTAAVLDWELPTVADPLWDAVMAQALLADSYGIDRERRHALRSAFWQTYGETPGETPRIKCYELLARIRLARHLTTEMQEESDTAVSARTREHNEAFDQLLDEGPTFWSVQDEPE